MPNRLEITLRSDLPDPEGEGLRKKAKAYFGLDLAAVRAVHILTLDKTLSEDQLETIRTEIFTNPVTQISAYSPLSVPFDWMVWVGYRPGVRDNPGATAIEAAEDVLGVKFAPGESIYTSRRYCIQSDELTRADADLIAGELLANDIIQQWRIFSREDWNPKEGIGLIVPKVMLNHTPTVTTIPIDSDETLKRFIERKDQCGSCGIRSDPPGLLEFLE